MAVRSGFVARSMLRNFGPLSVSFGFGGLDGDLIFPAEDLLAGLQEGVGLDVTIDIFRAQAPKTTIFFPDREGDIEYARLPVTSIPRYGPCVLVTLPAKTLITQYYRSPVIAQARTSPSVTSEPTSDEESRGKRPPVAVVRRRAPSGTAKKKS